MIVAIDSRTLQFAFLWMILGLGVYFGYSRKRSKLHAPGEILPKAKDFQ
jgi:APA family basic amino acid/polyamine antiporter